MSINQFLPHDARIVFRALEQNRVYELVGREAQTLFCLCNAGMQGVTAQELSNWALRLSAYIHKLRHDYGLDIVTQSEPNHDSGHHARYVLLSGVEIIDIILKTD